MAPGSEPSGRPEATGLTAQTGELVADLNHELDAQLADADARRLAQYPGDPSSRQPVHTVYVPADRFDAKTPGRWGEQASDLLQRFAPDAETLAACTGLAESDVGAVHERVLAKLAEQPIEDLRIDFEDGFGHRGDETEDRCLEQALDGLRLLADQGRLPPFFGIRFKCFEGPTRHRGVRTLTGFLAGLAERSPGASGALPEGLVVTLPKVTSVEQVQAMVHVCARLERSLNLPPDSLRFEVQVETAQAILGSDGSATVARLVHAAQRRCSGLHYGTFDYSAGLGIAAGDQSLEHPAADHAKSVMQVAAAQTGVHLSDGSTNVVAFDDDRQAGSTWALHTRLVTRALHRGYYQGWDMHPGHLPTRYLANYTFYRAAMPPAARRLRAYADAAVQNSAEPMGVPQSGGVMDEPATARALATALLRGLRCGALDDAEVHAAAGLDTPALLSLAANGQLPGQQP